MAAMRKQAADDVELLNQTPDENVLLADSELSSALLDRLVKLDKEKMKEEEDIANAEDFTGDDLRELLFQRYRKYYDLQFVVRALPGKRIVALNIMWKHLGLKSFPVTEEEYGKHLNNVAKSLKGIRQVYAVKRFIQDTRSKPRLGTAVSIPLYLEKDVEEALFPDDM